MASETIAEELQDLGVSLSDDLETTNDNILGMIADARDNFDEYQKVLADFQATISQGTTQIEHGKGTLVKAVKAADAGSTALQDAKDLLKSSRKNVRSFGTAFDQSLSDGESMLNSVYGTASVKLTGLETTASQAQQLITAGKTYSDKINTDSQAALDNLAGVVAVLGPQLEAQKTDLQTKLTYVESLLAAAPDNAELLAKKAAIEKGLQDLQSSADALTQLQDGLTNLQAQNAVLGTALDNFNASSSELTDVMTTIKTSKEQMDKVLAQGKTTLRDLRSGLNDNLMPGLHSALDTVSGVSGDLKSTLEHASATADQMQGVMDQLSKSLNEGSDALSKTGDTLSNLDERLAGIQNDLETLRASDAYKDILDLQEIDPDAVSEFMTSPIELTTTTFYEVEDYGSGMTPFYTNLALWVGGMVLIALLKQEVDEDEKVKKFTLNQAYFGRKLIFILLSVVQSLIICLGDVYLLKVQCMHPGLFILTGVVAGLIYLSLIYAVTAAFKHIGRAIFVFLVIIQIPGATGTFPVEMMGGFYKAIYRLMPFTYSNGAMRECIGGLYYNTWLRDMGILAAYLLLSLFIGVGLRPLLLNLNALFDRKLAEADLIIYEENNKTSDLTPELIARALQSDSEAREAYCERAARFEKRYPVRKRFGFLAMAVVPLIFLVLMFSVESKLIFLVLWICTLIGVSLYLIWLEYQHERMQKQLKLQGFSDGELLAALKEDRA